MKHKRQNKQLKEPPNLLKNKSDNELIALVTSLQLEIGLQSFTVSDLILRDAIIAQLEDRGYIVMEVLKIEHASKVEARIDVPLEPGMLRTKDKGEDEGEKGRKSDTERMEEAAESWTDN